MTTPSPLGRGPVERFECPGGSASVAQSGTVVLVTMGGNLDAVVGKRLATALNAVLEKSVRPASTFWDLEGLERYHSDVRVLCTQALLRNWARVSSVQTLATNRIVKMGVAVANVALHGRVHNTESRREFDALLRQALT